MKKPVAIIILAVLLSSFLCLSLQPTRAQSTPTYTLTQVSYGSDTMDKPALLHGQRYVFLGDGWGSAVQSPIRIWSADSSWNPVSLLTTTSGSYADFYVYTFPQLWNDTIIFCGSVDGSIYGPDSSAFIGSYNTTSNSYSIATYAGMDYITQVIYVASLDEFVIMPADGVAYQNYVVTCAPNDLLNTSSWALHGPFNDPTFGGYEKMFTYFQGYGWMIRWNSTGSSQLIQWNMATDRYTEPFNNTSGDLTDARQYISSNSTTLLFSTVSGNNEEYYYTNDGVTFTNFLILPSTGNLNGIAAGTRGDFENHAPIYPLTNQYIILGNIEDDNPYSFYALTTTSAVILEKYPATTHYSENTPLADGDSFVVGSEGYVYTSPTPTPTPMAPPPIATSTPTPTATPQISGVLPPITSSPTSTPIITLSKDDPSSCNFQYIIVISIAIAVFCVFLLAVFRRRTKACSLATQ